MTSAPTKLEHRSKRGKIRAWRKHKRQAQATAIAMASLNEDAHNRRAARIAECANRIDFLREGGQLLLRSAYRCKNRLCPVCDATKARQDYAILMGRISQHASQHPRSLPIMLTLTVPNVPVESLRSGVTDLLTAFRNLTRMPVVKRAAMGWHRSLEISFAGDGTGHPHLHVLIFVRPGYFNAGSPIYLTQSRWCELWCRATGLPQTIVHVKKIGRDRAGEIVLAKDGLFELTKYLVKPNGYYRQRADGTWVVDADVLQHLHNAVFRRRLRDVGGSLRKIPKPTAPPRPSDEELKAAHADFEIYMFGEWMDALGELHGPDYWQRAPPDPFTDQSTPLPSDVKTFKR